MNPHAFRPVLGVACLASLSVAAMPAMETDQAIPDDYYIGADLQSKMYDQGIVRNDDATLHERASVRWWDVGLSLDLWQSIGEDKLLPYTSRRGNQPQRSKTLETIDCNVRLDYLIEMKDYFQILPFVQWINYPNLPDVPLKDDQWYLGLDAWWLTPIQGVEIGGSFSYDPFYDVKTDTHGAGGWSSHHLLRGSFGSRQFVQVAPIDLSFWQVFNYGNENYNRYIGGGDNMRYTRDGWDTGFNVFDVGAQAIMPMPWKDWWLTMKLEGHFWIEQDERERVSNMGHDSKEWVISVGVRWWPTAEDRKG